MTTQELIDMALFDAFGLLEADERESFERAFAAASPALQLQIRSEQARFSLTEVLLPDIEPPAELRDAVLGAVGQAMLQDRPARHAAESRVALASALHLTPSQRVSPIWRASTLGCAAAAMVFAVATAMMHTQVKVMDQAIQDNQTSDRLIAALGPDVSDALFNSSVRHVMFTASKPGDAAEAVLLLDAKADDAWIVCRNLPDQNGRAYELVVLDDQNRIVDRLLNFNSRGQLMGQQFKFKAAPSTRLAIVLPSSAGASDGAIVMTTPVLLG